MLQHLRLGESLKVCAAPLLSPTNSIGSTATRPYLTVLQTGYHILIYHRDIISVSAFMLQ